MSTCVWIVYVAGFEESTKLPQSVYKRIRHLLDSRAVPGGMRDASGHGHDGIREQVDGLEVVLLRVVEVLVLRGAVLQGLQPREKRLKCKFSDARYSITDR